MKKIFKYLAFLIVLACLTLVYQSCYRDLSTEATDFIPEINITTEADTLLVYYGDELNLEPIVQQKGRGTKDFSYVWTIDSRPDSPNDRVEIGNELNLVYKVTNTPSEKPYRIILEVTDLKKGIQKIHMWSLFVSSSIGEGIMVAHTKDGGVSSDLDLVADKAVTYGFKEESPRYTRGLYSLSNGCMIEGRVNSISSRCATDGKLFNEVGIIFGTDSKIEYIDHLTLKAKKTNGQLFGFPMDEYKTEMVCNFAGYVAAAIVNNDLYVNICNIAASFNKIQFTATPSNIFKLNNVAHSKAPSGSIAVFDSNSGGFYFVRGWQASSGGLMQIESKPSFTIKGAKCIAGGSLRNSRIAFAIVAEDENSYLCLFDPGDTNPTMQFIKFDAPEIDQAVTACFCDNGDIFYYATQEKVYSVLLSGNRTVTTALTWKAEKPEERITCISQYTQAWYGTNNYYSDNYSFKLSTHRSQLLISTYNPNKKEGKIYARLFNIGTGLFTFSQDRVYSGFGEITAFCSTLR